MKKWFHNFCTNLVLTIYTKTFLCYDRNKKPNFAKIKLEILQSTLIRSRDWYQKDNVLKKWLYKFCQNLTLTIHIKEMSRLLAKRSNLANIKLEILQSIFLKWSRDLYQNVKILKTWPHNFWQNFILTIDMKNTFLKTFISRNVKFSKY